MTYAANFSHKSTMSLKIDGTNLFLGPDSGAVNSTGVGNTSSGWHAGYSNTTGSDNTFTGKEAGVNNTEGSGNTFSGYRSGWTNTTSSYNTFFGYLSGNVHSTGNSNTFIGYEAGYNNATGAGNVFLGNQAGYSETESNKLYIDNSSTSSPLIYGEFDNDIVAINGYVGIGTTSPETQLHVEGTIKVDQKIQADDPGGLELATDEGTTRLFIKDDGNVGIGMTAPSEALQVSGTVKATAFEGSSGTVDGTAPYLTMKNSTHEDTDGGRESRLIFQGEQSGGEISTLAKIQASHDGAIDDEKGDLIFYTNAGSDGSAPTERVRIDSSGKVGIGTTDPKATIDVNGYMKLALNSSEPVGCTASYQGSLALTSTFRMCVCDGAMWVYTSDGTTACTWREEL